ncbi:peroxisomal membrane protein 2 [Entelurus aequoreus]|uniref:peroxisomal membrane protein 2 n=1 Tax=Entelurus aequoreus TaxID=161455 RepID=UPI002B1CEFBF|nr:peroxisomal membrane protein 2 [Entelurus aequoreus]
MRGLILDFRYRPGSVSCVSEEVAIMTVNSLPLRDASVHFSLLQQYLFLLKKYPILTKSITSGILSALGNLLSQIVEARKKSKDNEVAQEIDTAGAARYAIYGLFITGPVSHYFYQLMEVWMPSTDPYCVLKRLLLDRLVFAPGFLLLFFFVMNILEVKGLDDFMKKFRRSYWTALKMNWRVWTPFQFININFVPLQFRVLFANMVALFWYAYLASIRK